MADTYTITRAITIAATPAAIYERIADLHRWTEWSPWEGLDPALHRDYSGAECGVGARYAWSGNRKAGRGEMSVTRADEPSTVVVDVTFEKPMASSSTSTFALTPQGAGSTDGGGADGSGADGSDTTLVTWTMTGPHSLFSRITGRLGLFDRLLGKDFEKGLARLKAVSES